MRGLPASFFTGVAAAAAVVVDVVEHGTVLPFEKHYFDVYVSLGRLVVPKGIDALA